MTFDQFDEIQLWLVSVWSFAMIAITVYIGIEPWISQRRRKP